MHSVIGEKEIMKRKELIWKQDAIDALGEEPLVWSDSDEEIADWARWNADLNAIKAITPVLLTVEPESDKAFWIITNIKNVYGGREIICSECGEKFTVSQQVLDNLYEYERFCRHCGSKMIPLGEIKHEKLV